MLVSEESLISKTLKNIPNYSDEKVTAFEIAEMFDNLREHELHKALIKSKEPDLNITIDWLVRHIVFDDNDASSVDFYDVFAGHRPGDPKTFAENFLKTDFFKGYYLSHKNFLNERWCPKCGNEFKNQFVEVFLMAALYRNSKGRIDPYCNGGQELTNRENFTDFTIAEQIDIDFNLHQIIDKNFFESIKIHPSEQDIFGLLIFENLILNWTEDFDEIDELMIPFPFGRLYKQINDGRFEKILKYLQYIMSPEAFLNIMETALDKFFDELFIFLKKFEKFVECRNSESYQIEESEDFQFFSEYCFKYNIWLEELCRNFLGLTLPHLQVTRKFGFMDENLVEILIRLYDDFLNLGIEEDLTDLTSDNEVGFIHFYPSHGRKLMRNELFKARKSIYIARIVKDIFAAFLIHRPRHALGESDEVLMRVARIVADWKKTFTRTCPGAFKLYLTEITLRLSNRQ